MLGHRRTARLAGKRSGEPCKSERQWPCLLPSIAVGIAPLRNLTGDPDHQSVVDGFTDRLVTELFRAVALSHSLGSPTSGVGFPTFHRQTHPNSNTWSRGVSSRAVPTACCGSTFGSRTQ